MIALIVPTLVASLMLGSDSGSAKAESLVKACRAAFNDNHLDTALADCNKAIALDPSIASAYAFRGDIKDVRGDHHGALADYNIALKLNPNYQYGYATRCDTRRELEDYTGAKADCTKAIGLNPGDGYAYDRFGYLDLDTGNDAAAVKHFTTALKNDPTLVNSYAGRCHAYDNLEKYSQALEDCKSALDIDPNSDDGLFYLAWAERNDGKAADAIGHWNTYIKRNPDDAVAFYNRGLANRDAGELAAAKSDFGTYIERKPKDGDGFYERGLVEEKLGDKDAALTDMKAALKLYQIAGDDQSAKQATDEINKLEGN
ncbi:MAG TPA: tetratricopeptide repeat protein [Candidatus Eremiobacteraceae bacterium]|nr:tetratricopeptide repeat protein [Candidatus Eremiobacteraceae bacterium]